MGFVFHYISGATENLLFLQPARTLKFYNFVCSIEGSKPRRKLLGDNEADRKIISFYVRYHYLRSHGDTTGSNALIGAWQKKLGHKKLWEDFNLGYQNGPPPSSGNERTHSRPARVATRKSTGGISTPNTVRKISPLPRRRSAEHHYFSDSSLTPLPSSDDEDDTSLWITPIPPRRPSSSSSGNALTYPPEGPLPRNSKRFLVGITGQGISRNHIPQDKNMDLEYEPPPTPPSLGVPVDSLRCEPTNYTTAFAEVIHGGVDDPMNGTSVSAVFPRSGKERLQSVTGPSEAKSASAPVPRSSSAPRRKRRRKVNWSTKKKRKKADYAEVTTDQPMTIAEPGSEREPLTVEFANQDITLNEPFIPRLEPLELPSLRISIHPPVSIPPIVQESRVPFSTSYANIPQPRPAPASDPGPSPDGLKGLTDTPAVAVPVFLRPTLPSNPPIWAQVR